MRVATLAKISSRLNEALRLSGKTANDVVATLDVPVTIQTWYRWCNGESQGGCRDVAQAALTLNMTPNQLLLEEVPAYESPSIESNQTFSARDKAGLEQLRVMLAELTQLSDEVKSNDRPVVIVCEHVEKVLRLVRRQAAVKPIGTSIQSPKYKKPDEAAGRSAEDPANYEKKKRRPKPAQ